MAPPAVLTLASVIEQLRRGAPSITLGICQGLISRNGDVLELRSLHGAVVGVSPHDDRPPELGPVLGQATTADEMIDLLVARLWSTRDYGPMLASNERLRGTVVGVADRRRLISKLRNGWGREVSLEAAAEIVDGVAALDAKQARLLATIAHEVGGATTWSVGTAAR
jgi:hypothetical protein